MMAGDVSVSVSHGDLKIDGDNAGSELVISSGANPGEFRIVGGNGTTINGLAELTVSGVADDVRIELRDGNNRIGIVDIEVLDDLRIRMGAGNDKIHVLSTDVTDRLNIRMDAGTDETLLQADARRANVDSGSGSDKVAIYFSSVQNRMSVRLGAGDDLG